MSRRVVGSYGVDALIVPVLSVIGAVAFVALGYTEVGFPRDFSYVVAALLLVQIVIYLHTTIRGRFLLWGKVLTDVPAPGRTLDVGCGRGMVLIETLLEFPDAKGVGLDLWRSRSEKGVARKILVANATENRVVDRTSLQIGDMTAMPFPNESFDLVTANIAIHDVDHDETGRREAVAEILRVTRRGGQIRIVDIHYVGEYRDQLRNLGAVGVKTKSLGINGWYGNPFYASRLVSATKK
ncbi:MAG: class I SAM-dependent methyltransferase [Actinobacteria bacterium]|nr:class I SAM-dependent methyltransferase [Actinomycetota bacterium]